MSQSLIFMLDAMFAFFTPRAAVFCCEGTAGNLGDFGFGAGSAVMFNAAPAPSLLVPEEHKPPKGDGGGHLLRDVYE
jgi:hypothetical protein